MTPIQALRFCEALLTGAISLQLLELWVLRRHWSDLGTWRWPILKSDWQSLPSLLLRPVSTILGERGFEALILSLLGAAAVSGALALSVDSSLRAGLLTLLLLGMILISARFRGAFNGGSDTATIHFLLGCVLGEWIWPKLGLGWICVQITLSYGMAGLVKARSPRWWNGLALQAFLESPRYGVPGWVQRQSREQWKCQLASFGVISFELLFPGIFLLRNAGDLSTAPLLVGLFLGLGALFHLANFWVFGLNRFFFAWLAGYPAVIWWALYAGS